MIGGDAFKKVQSGQPLRIPAEAYNAFIDAALANRQLDQQLSGDGAIDINAPFQPVLVQNTTESGLKRYSVLGIDGPLFEPSQRLQSWKNNIVLRGVEPDGTQHRNGKWVILTEPARPGAIVTAVAFGLVQVQVKLLHAEQRYADIEHDQTAYLQSADIGPAEIVWIEDADEEQSKVEDIRWALVRIGHPPADNVIEVKITGHEMIAPNKWRYSWVESMRDPDVPGGYIIKPGGLTSTRDEDDYADPLFNRLEAHNDGSGEEGVGIEVGEDDETGGWVEMLPLMTGVNVRAERRNGAWVCEIPNPVRYLCTPPTTTTATGSSTTDEPTTTTTDESTTTTATGSSTSSTTESSTTDEPTTTVTFTSTTSQTFPTVPTNTYCTTSASTHVITGITLPGGGGGGNFAGDDGEGF